jgi:hypothetical protein
MFRIFEEVKLDEIGLKVPLGKVLVVSKLILSFLFFTEVFPSPFFCIGHPFISLIYLLTVELGVLTIEMALDLSFDCDFCSFF